MTDATKRSGSSQKKRCPVPGNEHERASGQELARGASPFRGSTTTSSSPCWTSVGAASPPSRSYASKPPRRPPVPPTRRAPAPSRAGARGSARRSPGARHRRRRERVLDEPAERDCRLQRRRLRHSATVACGIGCALGPPGVVQASTSRSTRSGMRERELLRDHPAEARPDDVRPLDARLVEHPDGVAGHLGDGVRPRRRVALTDPAVVEEDHVEPLGQARQHGLPAPAGVPEAVDQEQRLALRRDAPRRSACRHAAAFSGSGSRRERSPRSRTGRLASPPGTKNTSRMNSAPSRNSGSESGIAQHVGEILHGARPGERAEPLVERACRGSRRSSRRTASRRRRARPSRAARA